LIPYMGWATTAIPCSTPAASPSRSLPTCWGALPTAAGIEWTDGLLKIHFSAIEANGNSIGRIDDGSGCDFSCGDGDPSHVRFFGATDPIGIKSITISKI